MLQGHVPLSLSEKTGQTVVDDRKKWNISCFFKRNSSQFIEKMYKVTKRLLGENDHLTLPYALLF